MADRRTQIMQAAQKALQQDGTHGFSFRTLADEIGIKSASIHYHFANKDALFLALATQYREDFIQELATITSRVNTLEHAIDQFTLIFQTVLKEELFCLCGMLAADITHLDDPVARELQKFFVLSERWLEQQYLYFDHQSPLSAADFAKGVMSAMEGALLLDRANPDTDHIGSVKTLITALMNQPTASTS